MDDPKPDPMRFCQAIDSRVDQMQTAGASSPDRNTASALPTTDTAPLSSQHEDPADDDTKTGAADDAPAHGEVSSNGPTEAAAAAMNARKAFRRFTSGVELEGHAATTSLDHLEISNGARDESPFPIPLPNDGASRVTLDVVESSDEELAVSNTEARLKDESANAAQRLSASAMRSE
ncbi:unnamed protein product [Vitrella brassicaformis CCMP3155]|uniref:Uncharacterized protein n=2 Tax=Vitrella brassicaformis TaxID=1169539 RepID=A0A0G4FVJ4_VITBC|nr:unnamed protein product [Vitrella brassicaformis CCMP3155]|eukprot:CEM18561.1 unnamed protein product [Vitrella brassicaformis CCMP3155]